MQADGGLAPDVPHGGQLFCAGLFQFFYGGEMPGQHLGGLLAHMADTKGIKHPLQGFSLLFSSWDSRFSADLSPIPSRAATSSFFRKYRSAWERISPFLSKLWTMAGPKPSISMASRPGKVGDVPGQLGGTLGAGAADSGFLRVFQHRGAAHRASLRHMELR